MRERRRKAAIVWAPVLGALVLGATACGGRTVSSDPPRSEPPQTRFEKRAVQLAQDWPKAHPVKGRHDDMLPLEDARRPPDPAHARTFTVTVGHGACDKDYGTHVRETGGLVVVSGWAKEKKDVDVCTDQLVTDKAKITLDKPLGERTVVDAATGKRLAGK